MLLAAFQFLNRIAAKNQRTLTGALSLGSALLLHF